MKLLFTKCAACVVVKGSRPGDRNNGYSRVKKLQTKKKLTDLVHNRHFSRATEDITQLRPRHKTLTCSQRICIIVSLNVANIFTTEPDLIIFLTFVRLLKNPGMN